MNNPANNDQVLNEIISQLQSLRAENQDLRNQLELVRNTVQQGSRVVTSDRSTDSDPKYPDVPTYDGKDFREAKQFIMKLDTFFDGQPFRYNTEKKKISYIIGRLTGLAWAWIEPYIEKRFNFETYASFKTLFLFRFSDPSSEENAETAIKTLKQGNRSAAAMASELRALATRVDWNEKTLMSFSLRCLKRRR